jgi:uncharacterized DUF497 family protein
VKFEWDESKDEINKDKHKMNLVVGALVWRDESRLVMPDNRKDYGEDRFNCIGNTKYGVLTICYTMRGKNVRLISTRPASKKERRFYHGNQKNES